MANRDSEHLDLFAVELDPTTFEVNHVGVFSDVRQMLTYYEGIVEVPEDSIEQLDAFPAFQPTVIPADVNSDPAGNLLVVMRGYRGDEFDTALKQMIDWRRRHPQLNPHELADSVNYKLQRVAAEIAVDQELDKAMVQAIMVRTLAELASGDAAARIPRLFLVPYVTRSDVDLAALRKVRSYPVTDRLKLDKHDLLTSLTSFLQEDTLDDPD